MFSRVSPFHYSITMHTLLTAKHWLYSADGIHSKHSSERGDGKERKDDIKKCDIMKRGKTICDVKDKVGKKKY